MSNGENVGWGSYDGAGRMRGQGGSIFGLAGRSGSHRMEDGLEPPKATLYRRGQMVEVQWFRYINQQGESRLSRKTPIFSWTAQVRIVNGWETGDHAEFYRGVCMDKASVQFIKKHADPKDSYIYFPRGAIRDGQRKNPL